MSQILFTDINYLDSCNSKTLSFACIGQAPVQKRAKITYKNKHRPVYYDPSNLEKKNWRQTLQSVFQEKSISSPVFLSDSLSSKGVKLSITFHIKRPMIDYISKKNIKILKDIHHKYPSSQDIDNLLKFVMDAMHEVVYLNDQVIHEIHCRKIFCDDDNTGIQRTEIQMIQLK